MKKEIGKLYVSGTLIVMCTGEGIKESRFSGVAVSQTDSTSYHHVGSYSNSWTWHPDIFKEYEGEVILNNLNWVEYKELGNNCN